MVRPVVTAGVFFHVLGKPDMQSPESSTKFPSAADDDNLVGMVPRVQSEADGTPPNGYPRLR